jgi:dUTP pyrophosphatase
MRVVHAGDKIAQMIISPFMYWQIKEVDKLDDTTRGEGGFGSTGVQ